MYGLPEYLFPWSMLWQKTRLARSSTTPHCLHAVGIFSTGQWVHVDCCRTLSCARIFLIPKGSFADSSRKIGQTFSQKCLMLLRKLIAKDWASISLFGTERELALKCSFVGEGGPQCRARKGRCRVRLIILVGCPLCDSTAGAERRIGASVYENYKRSSALPQPMGSLRKNEKRKWNAMDRGAFSQIFQIFCDPMGPLIDPGPMGPPSAAPGAQGPFERARWRSALPPCAT